MKITQQYIADSTGVTVQFVNQVVSRKRIPSAKRAKEFAKVSKTSPLLWLYGTEAQIRSALNGNNIKTTSTVK